jgi:hypothetical protein
MKIMLAALLLAVPVLGFAADAPKADNTKKCADLATKRDAIKAKKKANFLDNHTLHSVEKHMKALKCEDKAPAAKAPEAPAADKK